MLKSIAAALAAAAVTVTAVVSLAGSVQTPAATPTHVYAGYPDGSVYVKGLPNTANCNSALIRFTTADSDPDKILRIALAAQLSGKKLACSVDNQTCAGDHQKGYQCNISD